MFRFLAIISLVTSMCTATTSGQDGESSSAMRGPINRDTVAAGKALYNASCSVCHGLSGQGGRGPRLAEAPRIREMADRKILDVIRHGVPGTEMMGFPMPEPQLKQLVAFIRS